MEKKNGYILTRQWLDFARDNPAIVNATHYALVMVIIDLNNRLKWKTQFGLPTDVTMEEANIKTRKVYYKTLKNLVEWGFIKLVQKAKNNHTSNVIECVIFTQSRPSQPDLSESIRHTHDTLKTHIDKQRKTEKNFFKSEKVNFEFNVFLKNEEKIGRQVTEEREKALIETLNNIAQTEYDKIASIKQAISGGYPTFHAVKDRIKGTTECIEERKR